jgi:glyoxylase-like metal-dependent hydrolase (beta-lactamase superfamily II)
MAQIDQMPQPDKVGQGSQDAHRFAVGSVACVAVNDGNFPYTAQHFFATAPPERLAAALRQHGLQPDRVGGPWTCLLLDTGRNRVLLDTGGGAMAAGLFPGTGTLVETLRREGYPPEMIDTVILSHAHPDHIGGLTDGQGRITFPNARHVMSRKEWAFWTAEPTLAELEASGDHLRHMLAAFVRANLPPIQGRLDLVDGEQEVVPGVQVIPAPGHTPGHVAVAVYPPAGAPPAGTAQGADGADTRRIRPLFYLADTVVHPIGCEQPDWHTMFDVLPEEAGQSARTLLRRVVEEQSLVHAFHFPFPGLGTVAPAGEASGQDGASWRWRPAAGR